MDQLYIPGIILHLSIVAKKHSIVTITQLRSLELLTAKTPLLHMLYDMNWLTHDFWTEGWEFDRSHGAGTSSPSHWQQVEKQASKPVGWMMCFLLMTFVPIKKLCFNEYIYIYIYIQGSTLTRALELTCPIRQVLFSDRETGCCHEPRCLRAARSPPAVLLKQRKSPSQSVRMSFIMGLGTVATHLSSPFPLGLLV